MKILRDEVVSNIRKALTQWQRAVRSGDTLAIQEVLAALEKVRCTVDELAATGAGKTVTAQSLGNISAEPIKKRVTELRRQWKVVFAQRIEVRSLCIGRRVCMFVSSGEGPVSRAVGT